MTAAEGIAYGQLAPTELIEHFLDEDGLAAYVDLWQPENPEFSWQEMALHIWSLTRNHWQPSPEYLEGVYRMQVARRAA